MGVQTQQPSTGNVATVSVPDTQSSTRPSGRPGARQSMPRPPARLKLLPRSILADVNREDAINAALMRYYRLPILGRMYRRRVEMCLDECAGGHRILEVGFGIGLTFQNLNELYDEIYGLDLDVDVSDVAALHKMQGIDVNLCNGNVLDMPFEDQTFDTVLLISILEHLKPRELVPAFEEIGRVLHPGGQVVYGVPIERPFMVSMFRLLGWDIRKLHFSTEQDVRTAAAARFEVKRVRQMPSFPPGFGPVYEVGHFTKR